MANGDFLSGVRMNSIYGGGGIAPPDMGMDMSGIISQVAPYIEHIRQQDQMERDKERNFQGFMAGKTTLAGAPMYPPSGMANPHLAAIAAGMAGGGQGQPQQHVIMPPPMSDYQKAEIGLGKEKLAEQASVAGGKQQVAEEGQKTKQQRADIYDWKTKHPEMDVMKTKGGTIHMVNRITGETMDTGIDNGTVTDEEMGKINQNKAIAQIDERTKGQKEVQTIKGEQATALQTQKGGQQLANIAARVAGTSGKPESATQEKVRQQINARQLMNTRPDLAKFINVNPDNTFDITPSGKSNFFGTDVGPTPEQFKAINDYIYTPAAPTKPTTTQQPTKPDTKQTAQPQSKYKVTVE